MLRRWVRLRGRSGGSVSEGEAWTGKGVEPGPGAAPPPPPLRKHLGRKAARSPWTRLFLIWRRGMGRGRGRLALWPRLLFALGTRQLAVGMPGREGRGWRSRPSAALGLSLARGLPSVCRVPIPGACSLTVGPPALVSTSVREGDCTPQRVMGGPRGHWLVAESLALDGTRVRGRCRRTRAGEGGQRREAAVVEARVPG